MASPIKLVDTQHKGRALISTRPLSAGEIILQESPLLLYSATPPSSSKYCSHCFRTLSQSSTPLPCPNCSSSSLFCSSHCLSTALSSSHSPFVCHALSRLHSPDSPLLNHPLDRLIQARFLVSAYNLALVSPALFQTLLSLQGDSFLDENSVFLHNVVSSVCNLSNLGASNGSLSNLGLLNGNLSNIGQFNGNLSNVGLFNVEMSNLGLFSVEMTAALLAKDKINAFGLMEPFDQEKERSVRAYGIYPKGSFFNHDCLPNACRFDYVDSDGGGGGNVDIVVRVIHDLPEGREVCLSYFPVNVKYKERQRRLKEDYGFVCDCDRCKVEANWSDDEEGEGEMGEDKDVEEEGMDEDMGEDVEEGGSGMEKEDNDFPHAYFFVRYMCNRDNCWGTLAPLPPADGRPSTVMECNVCGNLSNSEDLVDGNQQPQ